MKYLVLLGSLFLAGSLFAAPLVTEKPYNTATITCTIPSSTGTWTSVISSPLAGRLSTTLVSDPNNGDIQWYFSTDSSIAVSTTATYGYFTTAAQPAVKDFALSDDIFIFINPAVVGEGVCVMEWK